MTKQKSFVKSGAMLVCLLMLVFSSPRVINGQKEQQPKRPGDATDKYVIIEGDIQVSPSFYQELVTAARLPQSAPIKHPTKLWPNGVVPFEFDANVPPANQAEMIDAMAVLEAIANVDFRQCGNNNCGGNYVHILKSARNSSAVGMKGGEQELNIISWTDRYRILHELLHCLGFFHEQSRPDRDNYVRPICENVKGGCDSDNYKVNFGIKSDATPYGPYDFDSIMHYGQCIYSVNTYCPQVSDQFPDGGITLQVREPYNTQWQDAIGSLSHLSDLDRMNLQFLYPAPDWRFLDKSYSGGNGSSNGSFHRPYTGFAQAINNTPEGGTIWLLHSQTIPAVGAYGKQVRVRVAPGVVATLGG